MIRSVSWGILAVHKPGLRAPAFRVQATLKAIRGRRSHKAAAAERRPHSLS